jgi:hypothetical protein
MSSALQSVERRATQIAVPIGPSKSCKAQLVPTRFAVVVRALWPRKTAVHLAARSGVAPRTAKHWLTGDRKPSVVAVSVIVEEITREFR